MSAFAETRLDFGISALRFNPLVEYDAPAWISSALDYLDSRTLPLPDGGLYLQASGGRTRLGVGFRFSSILIASIAFPNVYAEYDAGSFVLAAQAGGLWFALHVSPGMFISEGMIRLYFQESGGIRYPIIPDVSAWVRLGKHFRLGVGAIGLADLGAGDALPIVFGYAAGKFSGTF